jgi:hypothetical protein
MTGLMIHCTKCGAEAPEAATFCARCGAAMGGAGEHALEQLIDERAKAIVAAERALEAKTEADAVQEREREQRRSELEADAASARKALAENAAEPATVVGSVARSMRRVAWLALGIGLFPGIGLMIHLFLIPAFGSSPAGVVCPLVCDGCSPSARTFSWNFRGSYHSENGRMGYAFVCKNPKIDVDRLSVSDIWNRKTNEELQPYMLSSFLSWMCEVLVCCAFATLALGPIFGVRRRRRILAARPGLEAWLARAEAALRAFDGPQVEPEGPYR